MAAFSPATGNTAYIGARHSVLNQLQPEAHLASSHSQTSL